jgi:hypothetical protein
MIGLVWGLEWRLATTRRRLFAFNLVVPLVLVAPIAFSPAPAAHASAVYTVLFVIFGTFGSAIPLVRDGDSGLIRRFLAAGIAPAALLAGRCAATATLDALQLSPALIVILLATGAGPAWAPAALSGLLVAVLVANLLGAWVAAVARSLAEAALLSAVSSLLLLHAAGVFRTPTRGSIAASVERVVPFRLLHETLFSAVGNQGGAAVPEGAGTPLVVAGLVVLASLAAARWIVGSLSRIGRG